MYQYQTNTMPKAYSYLRFSTSRQKTGDSARRQAELASEYAAKHGLNLQSDTIEDLGVSAFHGRNNSDGALGAFIEAVRLGHIESGSWLLVESVDRLSRQPVESSFQLVSGILALGITVVTLQDGKVYERGQLDLGSLMILLVKAQTAFEESDKKSKRTRAAWDAARASLANGKKIRNARIPSWLLWNDDKTDFIINEPVAKTIRHIFNLSSQGFASASIARDLVDKGCPMVSGKKSNWSAANVNKVQSDRAYLGEFTPMAKNPDTGKREPIGESIQGYYPQLIEPEQFYEVQRMLRSRSHNSTSYRRGVLRNLFSGVIKCGCCGSSLVVQQKSSNKLKGKYGAYYYLKCARQVERRCENKSLNYLSLERLLVSTLIYLPSVIDANSRNSSLTEDARAKVVALTGELGALREQADKLLELLLGRSDNKVLLAKFDSISKEQSEKEACLAEAKRNLESIVGAADYANTYNSIFTEVNSFEAMTDMAWRTRYNAQLKRLLSEIRITTMCMNDDDMVAVSCLDTEGNEVVTLLGKRNLSNLHGFAYGQGGKSFAIQLKPVADNAAPIDLVTLGMSDEELRIVPRSSIERYEYYREALSS